jgi:hypothetical protein
LPLIPIAAFLAGALLTILLPLGLLIALVVWYYLFSVRVPETPDRGKSRTEPVAADPAAATPGPAIPESLPPEPKV